MLTRLHCGPSDAARIEDITSIYQTLLNSTLSTWSPSVELNSDTFVSFVQTVLSTLPSSSSSSGKPADISLLGDVLVDMVWSVDIELDEIIAEAKAAESKDAEINVDATQPPLSKKNAEADKDSLADVVKRLLVCLCCSPPCRLS
jgi:THO complex subunit 2